MSIKLKIGISRLFLLCGALLLNCCHSEDSVIADANENLIQSLGPCRPLQGRLSLQLTYAPYRKNSQTCNVNSRQRAALQRVLRLSPASQLERYKLLAQVLDQRLQGAAESGESALAQNDRDSDLLNDLAAIYMAEQPSHPGGHFLEALSLARKALDLEPRSPTAQFNLALALEKNMLYHQAQRSWGDYLSLDSWSPWAQEAKKHQSALSRRSVKERWNQKRPSVERLSLAGDLAGLRQLVREFPEYSKQYGENDLITQWATYLLKGDARRAEERVTVASILGSVVSSEIDDATALDLSAVIAKSTAVSGMQAGALAMAQGQLFLHSGRTLCMQGEGTKGLMLLKQARPLLKKSVGILLLDLDQAVCQYKESNYRDSLDALSKLLDKLSKNGKVERYPSLVARAHWMKGLCYVSQGDFTHALIDYGKASSIYSNLNFVESVGVIAYLKSEALRFLGASNDAWQALYEGVGLSTKAGDLWHMYAAFDEMADAASREGYAQEALYFRSEVVRLARLTPDAPSLAHAFIKRGECRHILGDEEGAVSDFEDALQTINSISDSAARRRAEADILLARAKVDIASNPGRAIKFLDQAYTLYGLDKFSLANLEIFESKARALIAMGKRVAAEEVLRAGVTEFESVRGHIVDDRLRMLYLETARSLLDEIVRLQSEKPDGGRTALLSADRARGRVLFDQVAQISANNSNHVSVPLREQACRLDVLAREMPPGSVFVEYSLLSDQILIWTVRKGDQVRQSKVLVKASEVEAHIAKLESGVHGTSMLTNAAAGWLYQHLVTPISNRLRIGDSIIISADKALQRIPFAMLVNSRTGRFMIQDYALAEVPSCGFLFASVRSVNTTGRKGTLIIGDPAIDKALYPWLPMLPGAATEVQEIARTYGPLAEVFTGEAATTDSLVEHASEYQIIHIAAHALGNPLLPDQSQIVLAPSPRAREGSLHVADIQRLSLRRVFLVVLATCGVMDRAGQGAEVELVLVRAFLASGVRNVIGNLWGTSDRGVSYFNIELHRRIQAGETPVEAMRNTQLSMLGSRDLKISRPSSWAGFKLFTGEL